MHVRSLPNIPRLQIPRLFTLAGGLRQRRYNYQRRHGATKSFAHGVQNSLAYSDQQRYAPAVVQHDGDDEHYSLRVGLMLCNADGHEQLSFCYLFESRIAAECYRQRSLCSSLEHTQVEVYTFAYCNSLSDCFIDPLVHGNCVVDPLAQPNGIKNAFARQNSITDPFAHRIGVDSTLAHVHSINDALKQRNRVDYAFAHRIGIDYALLLRIGIDDALCHRNHFNQLHCLSTGLPKGRRTARVQCV